MKINSMIGKDLDVRFSVEIFTPQSEWLDPNKTQLHFNALTTQVGCVNEEIEALNALWQESAHSSETHRDYCVQLEVTTRNLIVDINEHFWLVFNDEMEQIDQFVVNKQLRDADSSEYFALMRAYVVTSLLRTVENVDTIIFRVGAKQYRFKVRFNTFEEIISHN